MSKIYSLHVECTDCGAKVGEPCKQSMGAHPARIKERDKQRNRALLTK